MRRPATLEDLVRRIARQEAEAVLIQSSPGIVRRAYCQNDVARLLNLSRHTIAKMIEDGLLHRLPGTGRKVLIPADEMDRFLASRSVSSDL